MDANRLTARDVQDWMWFAGVAHLELWERAAIWELDAAWMAAQRSGK
jgi:hypothetical protein